MGMGSLICLIWCLWRINSEVGCFCGTNRLAIRLHRPSISHFEQYYSVHVLDDIAEMLLSENSDTKAV